MAFYTKGGSFPQHLPEMIILEDGNIRTESSTYTEEEIASAGWAEAPLPIEHDSTTHTLGWDYETSNWFLTEISQEEIAEQVEMLWRGVRLERNDIISQSDYMVIKAYECGTEMDADWASYRQALRDITNQDDPLSIVWPDKPE